MRDLPMKKPANILPPPSPVGLAHCKPEQLKLILQSDLTSVECFSNGGSYQKHIKNKPSDCTQTIYSGHQHCCCQRYHRSVSWPTPTLSVDYSPTFHQKHDCKCLVQHQINSELTKSGVNCWSDGASIVLDSTDDHLDESPIDEDVFSSPTTVDSSSSIITTELYQQTQTCDGIDCCQSNLSNQCLTLCCNDRCHSLRKTENSELKFVSKDEESSLPNLAPFSTASNNADECDTFAEKQLNAFSTHSGDRFQNTTLSTDSLACHMSFASDLYQTNMPMRGVPLIVCAVHQLMLGSFSSLPLFKHCIDQSPLNSKLNKGTPEAHRKMNLLICNAKRDDNRLWNSQLVHNFPHLPNEPFTSLIANFRLPWHPDRQRKSAPVLQSLSCSRDTFLAAGSVQDLPRSTFDGTSGGPRRYSVIRKERRTETPSSAPVNAGVFDFSDTDYMRTWLTPAEASRLPVKRSPPNLPEPGRNASERYRGSHGDIKYSIVSAKPSKLFYKKSREVAHSTSSSRPLHRHFSSRTAGDALDAFSTSVYSQQIPDYSGFQSHFESGLGVGGQAVQYGQQSSLPSAAYPNSLSCSSYCCCCSAAPLQLTQSSGYQSLLRTPICIDAGVCHCSSCCADRKGDTFSPVETAPQVSSNSRYQLPTATPVQPVFLDLTGCDVTLSVEKLPPFHPHSPPLRAYHKKPASSSRHPNEASYSKPYTQPEVQSAFSEQSATEICFTSTQPVKHFLRSTPSHMCDRFINRSHPLCFTRQPASPPPPYSPTVDSNDTPITTVGSSTNAYNEDQSSSLSSPRLPCGDQLKPCSLNLCSLSSQMLRSQMPFSACNSFCCLCCCCYCCLPLEADLPTPWSPGYLLSPPVITTVSHFHPATTCFNDSSFEPEAFFPSTGPTQLTSGCHGTIPPPHHKITCFHHPCGVTTTCSPCTNEGNIFVHSQPYDNQFQRHPMQKKGLTGQQPALGIVTDEANGVATTADDVRVNSGWVCVPEPIRVSRSQDVYNALRTCLVPHYALREYMHTAPPPRQWRRLEEPSRDGFAFTLMCYNILSHNYATSSMFPYCPSWALNWDYRRRAILDEIRVYHANIICLQEVETNQFEEIFKPELEKLNYDAVFLPKSRRRTMGMKECKRVDGCAIFWQTDKFEKLHEFHHEFMLSCSSMCENPTALMLNRVMTRDNVALGVIFQTKGAPGPDGPGGRQFCVTTGHIHWDPDYSDVKMIQTILWTAELWAYIDQFLTGSGDSSSSNSSSSEGTRTSPPGGTTTANPPTGCRNTPLSTRLPVPGPSSPAANMPVILCGDLNSLPNSGVVEFLMRGSLPKSHTDFRNNGNDYMFEDWRLLEKWALDGDIVRHRFAFDRAYQKLQGMKNTNYTYDFRGMIDYVLFTRQHFRVLGSLDQVQESWFSEKKIMGCPHVHIPSDHFALLVELELQPTPLLASAAAARQLDKPTGRNRCRSEGPGCLRSGHVSRNTTTTTATGDSASNWPDPAASGNADGSNSVAAGSATNAKHRRR